MVSNHKQERSHLFIGLLPVWSKTSFIASVYP